MANVEELSEVSLCCHKIRNKDSTMMTTLNGAVHSLLTRSPVDRTRIQSMAMVHPR